MSVNFEPFGHCEEPVLTHSGVFTSEATSVRGRKGGVGWVTRDLSHRSSEDTAGRGARPFVPTFR